jgi:hypothetical protein
MEKPNKAAQLAELKRELQMRQKVYPRWVREGRLSKDQMDFRVACLIEVIEDFEARHAPASQQGSLGL